MASNISRFFDLRATEYDKYSAWTHNEHLFSACMNVAVDLQPSVRCLDMGAGTAAVAKLDSQLGLRRWSCVDRSLQMALRADIRGRFIIGEVEALPFASSCFGFILLRSVLHYVDAERTVEEARRVLSERGYLVVAQKVQAYRDSDRDWHVGLQQLRGPSTRPHWSAQTLADLLVTSGFIVSQAELVRERREVPVTEWVTKAGSLQDADHDKVLRYLRTAPPSVLDDLRLVVGDETIAFDRVWAVLSCRKNSSRKPLPVCVVCIIVERYVEGQNCLLLQKRKKREERSSFGKWEIPQGKIEPNESFAEAARRELREETQLELNELHGVVIDATGTENTEIPTYRVSTADAGDYVAVVVTVTANGEPASVDLDREYRWMPMADIPALLRDNLIFALDVPILHGHIAARASQSRSTTTK